MPCRGTLEPWEYCRWNWFVRGRILLLRVVLEAEVVSNLDAATDGCCRRATPYWRVASLPKAREEEAIDGFSIGKRGGKENIGRF